MDKKQIKMVKLGEERPDMVYNKVWEVTCMTWPTPIPKKMDRTNVKLIRAV